MNINLPTRRIRTDYFKTKTREVTKYICVRDTLTKPEQAKTMTVFDVDTEHCRRGKLGVGYHFLILQDGTIVQCRALKTIGAHSRKFDQISVAIGLVGGLDEKGDRLNTRTPEQLLALEWAIDSMRKEYPDAEVDDNPN